MASIVVSGDTSGAITLSAPNVAGTTTLTLPTGNGTILSTTAASLTNATGLPISTGVSGLGTNVATFLGTPSSANLAAAITDETGSGALVFATSPTLVTPALGTPSSGIVTNLTGTASININGTVGATTPTTGAFTTATLSSNLTLNGGTANGVLFLNASKVATSGSALVFDGTSLGVNCTPSSFANFVYISINGSTGATLNLRSGNTSQFEINTTGTLNNFSSLTTLPFVWSINSFERARLSSDGTFRVAGAGTAGSSDAVQFSGSAPANSLVLNSSGNLGIGTSSPGAALDVIGNIRVSNGSTFYSQGTLYIRSGVGSNLLLGSNDANGYVILNTDANLGLNVSPGAGLANGGGSLTAKGVVTVAGPLQTHQTSMGVLEYNNSKTSIRSYGATAGTGYIAFNVGGGGNSNDFEAARISTDGTFRVKGAGSAGTTDAVQFSGGAPANSLILNSSGNLLMGTTTAPSSAQNIFYARRDQAESTGIRVDNQSSNTNYAASFITSSSYNADISIGSVGSNVTTFGIPTIAGLAPAGVGYLMSFSSFPMAINHYFSQPIVFGTANTERMRLTSSGDLLVGTTGLPYANGILSVSGHSRFYQSTADSSSAIFVDKSSATNTTSQVFVQFTISNQSIGSGQINANGASQAAFGSFSDARLKQNIVNLTSQLANIMALRPVEFDYIEKEGGGHQIGFIAQEMQEVYPDAVGMRAPDQMLTVTGWSKTEARLVKAIQEQQSIIESLAARIAALEAA